MTAVDKWVILSGLALIVLLTCFATLQAVLGMPSRARIVERMNKYGMHAQLGRFRRHRAQLALAAATLRTVCVLSLALLVYEICRRTMTGGVGATYAVALFVSLFIVLQIGRASCRERVSIDV